MRFLLSFIVFISLSMAPVRSHAGIINAKQTATANPSANKESSISSYPAKDIFAVIPVNSISHAAPQHRYYPYTAFINTPSFINKGRFLDEKEFLVASYSYCKPIGLILVFPQHYYW